MARRITVVAFDPGQVFGTGLARTLSLPRRLAWSLLGTSLGAPLRLLTPTMNTRSAAGDSLAALVLGAVEVPDGAYYAALRRGSLGWRQPSAAARRDDLAAELWERIGTLVGVEES